MRYTPLPLDVVDRAVPVARALRVSDVARSKRGFVSALRRAGSVARMSPSWRDKRDGFIARHVAQAELSAEPWWSDGYPTRRHIALVMWAYSPTPRRLMDYLERTGL